MKIVAAPKPEIPGGLGMDIYLPAGCRVVGAHVSLMDPPREKSI
jgi:hypothetical protein